MTSKSTDCAESAANAQFRGWYYEWLACRTCYQDLEISDEKENKAMRRADELARLITTTPATSPWTVDAKFEVLEHYMNFNEGTNWNDNREIVMLAGIKADLKKRLYKMEW